MPGLQRRAAALLGHNRRMIARWFSRLAAPRRVAIPPQLWDAALAQQPCFDHLDAASRERLCALAGELLAAK